MNTTTIQLSDTTRELSTERLLPHDPTQSSFSPAIVSTPQNGNSPNFTVSGSTKSYFGKLEFSHYIHLCLAVQQDIAYVAARIIDIDNQQYVTDANALHSAMYDKLGELKIKKIEYFSTPSREPPRVFTHLTTITDNQGHLSPSPFVENYITACSQTDLGNQVFGARKEVIKFFMGANRLSEAAFWVEQTSNDFPNNEFTIAPFFALRSQKIGFHNPILLRQRAEEVSNKFFSIKNLFWKAIGVTAAVFMPPEAVLATLGCYWISRAVISTQKKCGENEGQYLVEKARINSLFQGVFAEEIVHGLVLTWMNWPIAQNDYTGLIRVANVVLGAVSVGFGWNCGPVTERCEASAGCQQFCCGSCFPDAFREPNAESNSSNNYTQVLEFP